MIFDPFGWLERFIPKRLLYRMTQIGVIAILIGFLIRHVNNYKNFILKPLWIVEGLIFTTFLIIYIIRTEPIERSAGFKEVLIPVTGGILPFTLLMTPPSSFIVNIMTRLYLVFFFMTAFSLITLWGLWTLRRSFAITVEARSLVTNGPYRFIRHPVYLGEILTASTVMVWRFSILNLAIFSIFLIIQILRAKWEEKKMTKVFPEYSEFASRSWWILN